MTTADNIVSDPRTAPMLAEVIKLAQGLYTSGMHFLQKAIEDGVVTDVSSQDLVNEAGKSALATLSRLVDSAKTLISSVSDPNKQSQLESTAKVVVNSGQLLESSCTALSSALMVPECRSQMAEVTKATGNAVKALVTSFKTNGINSPGVESLLGIANDLARALEHLADVTECAEGEAKAESSELNKIQSDLQHSLNSMRHALVRTKFESLYLEPFKGDRNAMIAATKDMASNSTQIVNAAKSLAKIADSNTRNRLLETAKNCADAVSSKNGIRLQILISE